MPSIFNSLNTASRAVSANRLGIDVSSHNIANVNTPGYSRQRVNITTSHPMDTIYGAIGTGVDIGGVNRIRNSLLDVQFRNTNHNFGRSSVMEQMFYQVETIIQEPSDNSIGSLMDDFFNAFSELGGSPEDMNLRNVLIQKTGNLSQAFQTKSGRLREIQSSLRRDAESSIRQVNQISRQISELNRQIAVSEDQFSSANDLRDQRDNLLDQLSEFVQIQSMEDSNGQITVTMNGQMLVSQTQFRELGIESEGNGNQLSVFVKGSQNQRLDVQTGKLSGIIEMHNTEIASVLDRLDTLAKSFIDEVNQIHRAGKGLPTGSPPVANTGLNFFTGSDASTIEISSTIRNNTANIAASNDGSVGNGEAAFAISNLRSQRLLNARSETFADYYNFTVTDLGTGVQLAGTDRQNQELLRDQITNQRESESGVSLDEEMTNLIKYQRSLEAAARVIGIVDDILEAVINL